MNANGRSHGVRDGDGSSVAATTARRIRCASTGDSRSSSRTGSPFFRSVFKSVIALTRWFLAAAVHRRGQFPPPDRQVPADSYGSYAEKPGNRRDGHPFDLIQTMMARRRGGSRSSACQMIERASKRRLGVEATGVVVNATSSAPALSHRQLSPAVAREVDHHPHEPGFLVPGALRHRTRRVGRREETSPAPDRWRPRRSWTDVEPGGRAAGDARRIKCPAVPPHRRSAGPRSRSSRSPARSYHSRRLSRSVCWSAQGSWLRALGGSWLWALGFRKSPTIPVDRLIALKLFLEPRAEGLEPT